MHRFSPTLYLCDDVVGIVAALERAGWKRAKKRAFYEAARLTNGDGNVVIAYENGEIAAKGAAAIAALERLWRDSGAFGFAPEFSPIGENPGAAAQASAD